MRNFLLETHFAQWEFKAKYHLTASDAESMTIRELLDLSGNPELSLDDLYLGYTETWGSPGLLAAIANTYDNLTTNHILCFAGAEEGVYTAMRVLLNKDDHAIVAVPNYQAAETIPLDICEVSGVRLHPDNNWRMDLDELRNSIRPNTKLISINFPNNPTGAIMPADDYLELIALCREHGLYLFSDEVYRLVELDESKRIPQAADIYEKGLSLNVMSKAYGLPGLRIGWIACQDRDVLSKMERYKHYLSICNSAPSERLAEIALDVKDKILSRNRQLLQHNAILLDEFFSNYPDLFDWQRPDGSCVAYLPFKGKSGVENFCKSLVEESGVLLLPGSIYQSELIEAPANYFRIGFGRSNLAECLDAFHEFIHRNHNSL